MSAAARKRIAEAQRKRWAALKETTTAPPAKKVKRRMSAEGKRRSRSRERLLANYCRAVRPNRRNPVTLGQFDMR